MLIATLSELQESITSIATRAVRGDRKKPARLAVLSHVLERLGQDGAPAPDPEVLFDFDVEALSDGRLAR